MPLELTPELHWHSSRRTWDPPKWDNRMSKIRFLFRVFDPTCLSPYNEKSGFVASKFSSLIGDEKEINVSELWSQEDNPSSYDSVVDHLDDQKNKEAKRRSPWISTSALWAWAVWRLEFDWARGLDPKLAVIDLQYLELDYQSSITTSVNETVHDITSHPPQPYQGLILHALHALSIPKSPELQDRLVERRSSLENFANAADEVLVFAHIPASAIVSIVEFKDIFPFIPDYFPKTGTGQECKFEWNTYKHNGRRMGRFPAAYHHCAERFPKQTWDANTFELGRSCAKMAYSLLWTQTENLLRSLWVDDVEWSEQTSTTERTSSSSYSTIRGSETGASSDVTERFGGLQIGNEDTEPWGLKAAIVELTKLNEAILSKENLSQSEILELLKTVYDLMSRISEWATQQSKNTSLATYPSRTISSDNHSRAIMQETFQMIGRIYEIARGFQGSLKRHLVRNQELRALSIEELDQMGLARPRPSKVGTLVKGNRRFNRRKEVMVKRLERFKTISRAKYWPADPQKVAQSRYLINNLRDQAFSLALMIPHWRVGAMSQDDWKEVRRGMISYIDDELAIMKPLERLSSQPELTANFELESEDYVPW